MNVKNRRTYEELIHSPLSFFLSVMASTECAILHRGREFNAVKILRCSTALFSSRLPETKMTAVMINEQPDYFLLAVSRIKSGTCSFLRGEWYTFLEAAAANCRIPLSNHDGEVGEYPWVEKGREFDLHSRSNLQGNRLASEVMSCIT